MQAHFARSWDQVKRRREGAGGKWAVAVAIAEQFPSWSRCENSNIVLVARQLRAFDSMSQTRWLKLRVIEQGTGPGTHDDEAFVTFKARFQFINQVSLGSPRALRQVASHCRRCICVTIPKSSCHCGFWLPPWSPKRKDHGYLLKRQSVTLKP